MTHVVWDHVSRGDVLRAMKEYDRLGLTPGFEPVHVSTVPTR